MPKPLMRIPYTGRMPDPLIVPRSANTPAGSIAALIDFLSAKSSRTGERHGSAQEQTVLLTGAGISVASGLADYRGTNGTYTLNKTYRPIYYNEFLSNHEARKRYWARSYLGWTNLNRAKPNPAHWAVKDLGDLGLLSSVITQNVDSFHNHAHPSLPTIELHGYLRSLVCLTCRSEYSRAAFQRQLSDLNPAWAKFLESMLASGALDTEHPEERRKKGLKTNPDGDVDLPDAPYSTFRYPACPTCLTDPPTMTSTGEKATVEIDADGAWVSTSNAGVLKPAVIMFGESIGAEVKQAAEESIDAAGRILVIGSSLATYSAWRLVKRAHERGMPIGILNLGGARGEEAFFAKVPASNTGQLGVRCSQSADKILPDVVKSLYRDQR
ncbi:DHS-like NAD/FAD-binding domain-containing protein [Viridothelium virens]|uniref:DHS-like NAD/FAD-binding domain-containing protein n=1 Tax=Viridothelium virens TaxID=1048519 RepID=A0A6A6H4V0_VIRVR|nr:DHS-like NAD/FAD-binding domain-containing protein [Viridothelium virens]